jgi:TolA-binding protein
MGQLKNALETLNTLARDFPESPLVKDALFHIGLVFRKVGKGDKALPYFNKVLNMTPSDDLNEKAMKHIQMIQKGG